MQRIVTVGSINADSYLRIARLPRPGETLAGRDPALRPGGKGANQAACVARLGVASRFVGQVGDDGAGAMLRDALVEAGVEVDRLATVAGPSGQALILLQDDGENSIILVGGANQAWAGFPETCLDGAAAVLLQREIPEAINLAAVQAAQARDIPVILDVGGAEGGLPDALLAGISVLSPNETELARLTGLPTETEEQILAAAATLTARGVGTVLIKLGSRGSLLVEDDRVWRQGIFAADVADTTGAGDCFTASYAVALVEGRAPQDRLRFAAAAAAICVSRLGAMPSMPDRPAVEALLGYDRLGQGGAGRPA